MTAVLGVDVLDDFFATLVLEIDIDVGRFVALATDEALEEHVHAIGINRRDTESETDRTVGGRASTLTENATRTREGHDLMHGQKVRRVAKIIDDRELVLELLRHFGRHSARIPLACAFPHQRAQVLHGTHALRNDLIGIFVTERLERKLGGALEDAPRGRKRFGHVAVATKDFRRSAQAPLSVMRNQRARALNGDATANARKRVEQRSTGRGMHAHVMGCRHGKLQRASQDARTLRISDAIGIIDALQCHGEAMLGVSTRSAICGVI